VRTPTMKELASDLAEALPGVQRVKNELQIIDAMF